MPFKPASDIPVAMDGNWAYMLTREHLAHGTEISLLQSQCSAAAGFPGTKDNLPL